MKPPPVSVPSVVTAPPLKVPERYEIVTKLASGGMGTVFIGKLRGAAGFSRLVAIKRAHPHLLDDPSFRQAFIAEAQLAARIHHANVVSVVDVDERDGELRIVMEYVDGLSLSALIEKEPLPARVIARILIDVAAGLDAAHRATDEEGTPLGIVHRDVSPQNILVAVDGIAKVTDFGIAKSAHPNAPSTQQGVLKGKYRYMAPEYVGGGEVTPGSDVFSLGVVAWEALAGARLFRGSSDVETLKLVQQLVPPPLGERDPALAPFDPVVERALEKDPVARYRTAEEFARALQALPSAMIATHAEVATAVRERADGELGRRRSLARAHQEETAAAIAPVSAAEVDVVLDVTTAAQPSRARRWWLVLPLAALVTVAAFVVLRREPAPVPAPASSVANVPPSAAEPASSPSAPGASSVPSSVLPTSTPASSTAKKPIKKLPPVRPNPYAQ